MPVIRARIHFSLLRLDSFLSTKTSPGGIPNADFVRFDVLRSSNISSHSRFTVLFLGDPPLLLGHRVICARKNAAANQFRCHFVKNAAGAPSLRSGHSLPIFFSGRRAPFRPNVSFRRPKTDRKSTRL